MTDKEIKNEAIRLLNDLAELQNDAPLEQHRKDWEQTMNEVYKFLKEHQHDKTDTK